MRGAPSLGNDRGNDVALSGQSDPTRVCPLLALNGPANRADIPSPARTGRTPRTAPVDRSSDADKKFRDGAALGEKQISGFFRGRFRTILRPNPNPVAWTCLVASWRKMEFQDVGRAPKFLC